MAAQLSLSLPSALGCMERFRPLIMRKRSESLAGPYLVGQLRERFGSEQREALDWHRMVTMKGQGSH